MRSEFIVPIDFRRSPKWMSPLHAFAQWQGTYINALALNQLLMLPLESVSPACLYDGKLAMFFAYPDNDDHLAKMLPIDRELYMRLVGAVLPRHFTPPPALSHAHQQQQHHQHHHHHQHHKPPHHKKSNQPPRFQNAGKTGAYQGAPPVNADGGGGGGGGGGGNIAGGGWGRGRGKGMEGNGRGKGRGGKMKGRGSSNENWKPRKPGPSSDGRARLPSEGQSPKGQGPSHRQQKTATAKGTGPPPKVVDTKPPKFTHANRYAALVGEEEESGEDDSLPSD